MMKICPKCKAESDGNFCPECGEPLMAKDTQDKNSFDLNIGRGSAVNGDVRIDNTKNVTSNDTHFHSTIHERSKSEAELKLESTNQLRTKAAEIITERKRIDSIALGELRSLALTLGIDEETFKSIIKDVRSNNAGQTRDLGAINSRYLKQAQEALQTNDWSGLYSYATSLEAMATMSTDENIHYLYHLITAIKDPGKCITIYEQQTDENYWRTFWAIISYIRKNQYNEAEKNLVHFLPDRFDKSETDSILLAAYFHLVRKDNNKAQSFINEILEEPSKQLVPFLRAIESALYKEEVASTDVRFYNEQFFPQIKEEPVKIEEVKQPIVEKKNDTVSATANDTTPAYAIKALNNIISTTKKPCSDDEYERLDKYIKQLDQAIRTSKDEQMHFYYFLIKASREPEKCIKLYESKKIESYWLTYWSAYAYAYLDKLSMAHKAANTLRSSKGSSYPSANIDLLFVLIDVYKYALHQQPDAVQIMKSYKAIKGKVSDELLAFDNSIKYVLALIDKDAMTPEDMFYSLWVTNAGWRYGETKTNNPVSPTGIISNVYASDAVSRGCLNIYATLQVDNHQDKTVNIQLTMKPQNGGESYIYTATQTCPYSSTVWEDFAFCVPENKLVAGADMMYHYSVLIQIIDPRNNKVLATNYPSQISVKSNTSTLPQKTAARLPQVNIYNLSNQIQLCCSLELDNCMINHEYPITVEYRLAGSYSGENIYFTAKPPYASTVYNQMTLATFSYNDLLLIPEMAGKHDVEFIIRVHDEKTRETLCTKTIVCQLEGKYNLFRDPSIQCTKIYRIA